MQVNDKIYIYKIRLDFKEDKVEQSRSHHKVIGVNDCKLVIDDRNFTTIKLQKDYSGDRDKLLNEVLIIDFTDEDCFNFIEGVLRTTESKRDNGYQEVKEELEKYVNKKLSRYGGAVELLKEIEI